jgi:RNA polymerase sigma factor (sigma-70 family)
MPAVDMTLEVLAERAVDGDRDAVHRLVAALQHDVYRLARRMLWHREDAEDATQEILVRVVTRLAQYDSRSRLTTWVYRIATNYLLDVKKSPVEQQRLGFARFAEDLGEGLSDDGPAAGERSLLVEEVKIGCTLGMLQCLDRPHRLAYVLGEIFELPAPEAAQALAIAPSAFRKRLQRARERIESFTRTYCGLADDAAGCRCHRRVSAAVRLGRADPDAPRFASAPASFEELRGVVRRVERGRRALAVHRTSEPSGSLVDFARRIAAALETGDIAIARR